MEPYSAETLRDSTVNWAVWKALDFLTARLLTPLTATGGHSGPPHGNLAGGHGGPPHRDAAGAPPSPADPAALALASRQLADPQSPVLRALAAIWAQRDAAPEAGLAALSAQLDALSREEGLVVLAVVAQALQQA